MSFYVR